MNLDRVQYLLSKLSVKHRDLNINVPFIFNSNQVKAHAIVKQHYAETGMIRAIVLKARRVGMSSYWDSLLFCHNLARSQAHAVIVAHLKDVADKGLFRVPRDLALELNDKVRYPICDVRAKEIHFSHKDGDSRLDIATAGSVGGGRGLTLTALHLSEAAQYPGQDSFLGILPAVSKAPDTIISLESTAQGRVGQGKVFYEHWMSAGRKGRQWNGYQQIFLSWLDDPACVGIERQARDAPATDLERDLMKEYGASRAQIAWMRRVLEGECQASEQKFLQEYPHTAEVAFVATGDPAFTTSEIKYAYKTRKEPVCRGEFFMDSDRPTFRKRENGRWRIYETPLSGCNYYIGGDCARGLEAETGRSTGDFTALGVINGTTGYVAAKFSEWVNPEEVANEADKVGRYYNRAMVNFELTGNLGLWAQKELRVRYGYPSIYVWKGKDDKVPKPGPTHQHAQGWETNSRTRDLLFATFRGGVRDGMNRIPGGLELNDAELIEQMDAATMSTGMRFEVEKGHDDVLFAFMLAYVARAQWPPANIMHHVGNYAGIEIKKSNLESLNPQQELQNALAGDLKFIFKKDKSMTKMGKASLADR